MTTSTRRVQLRDVLKLGRIAQINLVGAALTFSAIGALVAVGEVSNVRELSLIAVLAGIGLGNLYVVDRSLKEVEA